MIRCTYCTGDNLPLLAHYIQKDHSLVPMFRARSRDNDPHGMLIRKVGTEKRMFELLVITSRMTANLVNNGINNEPWVRSGTFDFAVRGRMIHEVSCFSRSGNNHRREVKNSKKSW